MTDISSLIKSLKIEEKINNVTEIVEINTNINISTISDFKSDEFFKELTNVIDGRIIKHKNDDKYYIFFGDKWKQCDIAEAINFMIDKFSRYLISLKANNKIKESDKKTIEIMIEIWKNGECRQDQIFVKIIKNYLVDDKILDTLKIYNTENKLELTKNEPKFIDDRPELTKTAKIINQFMCENITFTSDKNDIITANDLYKEFNSWCKLRNHKACDIRPFGRALSKYNITVKHTTKRNIYLGIKLKKEQI